VGDDAFRLVLPAGHDDSLRFTGDDAFRGRRPASYHDSIGGTGDDGKQAVVWGDDATALGAQAGAIDRDGVAIHPEAHRTFAPREIDLRPVVADTWAAVEERP